MTDNYLIFSDESGCWSSSNPYDFYVRSWVRVKENDFPLIENTIKELLIETNGKEIKWDFVRNNISNLKNFANNIHKLLKQNFQTFVTISIPQCADNRIEQMKTFIKINEIPDSELTGYKSDSRYFKDVLLFTKDILVKMTKHFLFMQYYERQHTISASIAFSDTENNKWFIDNPQCSKDLWQKITYFSEVKLIDSKKSSGIQLADIIAGCYRDLLKVKTEPDFISSKDIYLKFLKSKQVVTKSPLHNPEVVFSNDSCADATMKLIAENIWDYK